MAGGGRQRACDQGKPLLEDLPGGRVRILTQATQIGAPTQELARTRPTPMLNTHPEWIDGLAGAARRATSS